MDDHNPTFAQFKRTLIADTEAVFASVPFQSAATSAAGQVEENRLALAGALRAMPDVVRMAKATMQENAQTMPFLCLSIDSRNREDFEAHTHPEVSRDEAWHGANLLLSVRAHLYARFTRARRCAVMLHTDGTEAIHLSWGAELAMQDGWEITNTWARPSAPGPLAHDPSAFLIATGMLYDLWKGRTPDRPTLQTVREDGTQHVHVSLPPAAAALEAVGRWPVRFAHAPSDLDGPLSALICAPFPATDD